MSDTSSFIQGLSGALSEYLGQANTQTMELATDKEKANIQAQKQIEVAKAQYDIDNPSAGSAVSYMSPDMAEKALPGYGNQMVQDYNQRNPNSPLTITQAADFIGKAHEMLQAANPDTSKQD